MKKIWDIAKNLVVILSLTASMYVAFSVYWDNQNSKDIIQELKAEVKELRGSQLSKDQVSEIVRAIVQEETIKSSKTISSEVQLIRDYLLKKLR